MWSGEIRIDSFGALMHGSRELGLYALVAKTGFGLRFDSASSKGPLPNLMPSRPHWRAGR
jgi:hypothetical protein